MRTQHAARRVAASTLLVAALGIAVPATADEAAASPQPAAAASAPASSPAPAAAVATAQAPASEPVPAWTLAELPDEPVPFQGMPNLDAAGAKGGTMLYPAPSLIGLVAAIATHALIQGGIDSHNKSKMQLEADKVLDPYRDVLAGFRLHELQQRALAGTAAAASAHFRASGDAPPTDWLVQAVPAFAMTPDGSALVLDDIVSVRAANVSTPAFQQTVRVVTPARGGELVSQWHEQGGAPLKDAAVAMMAEALDIALEQARHPVDDRALPYRTVRYVQGNAPMTERAQLVSETCGRMVIRTLRGGMMSVPHRLDATLPAGCPPPAPVPPIVAPAAPASAPADVTPSKEAAAQPAGAASASSAS